VQWPRYIPSLRAFKVSTHGIFTDHDTDAHRVLALISYPEGADPPGITAAYMASPAFAADMDGFDVSNIINVEKISTRPPPHHGPEFPSTTTAIRTCVRR